jgi:hypothetical protein
MMFLAGFKSILKRWAGDAVTVLVRLKALAPYALIEIVLPGGSLVALLLWLYRQKKNRVGFAPLAARLLSMLKLTDPLHFEALARGAPMTSVYKQR